MRIHADFSRRVTLATDEMPWVASPQVGVERRMLDRIGQEKARATSLVRYAPGSVFPAHAHPGGEEILVLSGTFEEGALGHGAGEVGHLLHPAGSYLRNPPGSSHQPASKQGAVIFVKLWQMHPDERDRVHVDTTDPGRWQSHGDREECELFEGFGERVVLLRLQAGARLLDGNEGGAAALVLEGGGAGGACKCIGGSRVPGRPIHQRYLRAWGLVALPRGRWLGPVGCSAGSAGVPEDRALEWRGQGASGEHKLIDVNERSWPFPGV